MVRGVVVSLVADLEDQSSNGSQALEGWPAGRDEANLFVDVTSMGGTAPTLDIKYQCGPSPAESDFDHTSMPQITATGKYRIGLTHLGAYGRVAWEIGGISPSIDFKIEIEGKQTNRR